MSSGESEGGNNGGSNETGVQQDNHVPQPPLNLRLTKTPQLINLVQSILYYTPIGVARGLACTPSGQGSTPYIITVCVGEERGNGSVLLMGQHGNLFKHSGWIAYSVARRTLVAKEPENPFFTNSKLHIYIQGGHAPVDGLSRNCTMITSLLSLAMKKPVRKNLAMTGAVTLTGIVIGIAGVREKTIAAKRNQVKMIIFPEANRREFEELEDNVKQGLDARFVDDYNQIFELVFDSLAMDR